VQDQPLKTHSIYCFCFFRQLSSFSNVKLFWKLKLAQWLIFCFNKILSRFIFYSSSTVFLEDFKTRSLNLFQKAVEDERRQIQKTKIILVMLLFPPAAALPMIKLFWNLKLAERLNLCFTKVLSGKGGKNFEKPRNLIRDVAISEFENYWIKK